MASPFRWFRKHQKLMMVVLILLAMFSFIFGFMVQQLVQLRSGGPTVAVKTEKYGNIDERQLQLLLIQRRQVITFLQRVQMAVEDAKHEANLQVAEEKDRVPETAAVARGFERMIGPVSEEAVVDTWLCAQYAGKLGLVVSEKAIKDFIRQVTEDCVDASRVEQIIRDLNSNPQWFFELLGQELLAMRVQLMFDVSLAATTPAQRWEYYTRLERQAKIEAIPVPVADYVDKVEDPDEKTLQEFFEQHKETTPDPTSPEPGFRWPRQVAVRYYMAVLPKFMSAVSDEEALDHYLKNRELYDRESAGAAAPPPAESQQGEEEPEDAQTPAEEPATEGEQTPAAAEQSPDQAPAEGADEPAEPPDQPSDSDETSSAAAAWTISLASLLQEGPGEPETAGPDAPAGQAAGPDGAAVEVPGGELEGPDGEAVSPAAESAGPDLAPQLPAEETQPGQGAAEAGQEPAEGSGEPLVEPLPVVPEGPPEDPLAGERGERIRRDLALQKIEEIFDRLEDAMHAYRDRWVQYEVAVEGNRDVKMPEEPNYDAVAKENDPTGDGGLSAGVTPLMSQWDFVEQQSGIGQSFVYTGGTLASFAQYAFAQRWEPYVAARSAEIGQEAFEQNRYLFWKVEQCEEHEPVLDKQELAETVEQLKGEAAKLQAGGDREGARQALQKAETLAAEREPLRRAVLEAWKMSQARELALKEARRLADEAGEAGLPLRSTFLLRPDLITPQPFSWMTRGNVPAGMSQTPPRLSRVEGVEMPGPDFMRTVFELQKGQIGVTMNHPRTIAYVVRVIEFNKSDEVLQQGFEVDGYYTYADVAQVERAESFRHWREGLKESAGLQWVRPARAERGE